MFGWVFMYFCWVLLVVPRVYVGCCKGAWFCVGLRMLWCGMSVDLLLVSFGVFWLEFGFACRFWVL